MKIIIFLFAYTIFMTRATAALQVYAAKDENLIPAEIALILSSLPPDNLLPDEKMKLNAFITNFSQYAVQLQKSDLFFVVKAESAKLLLASRPDSSSLYKNFNIDRILEIEKATDWPAYSPWAQFVFRSLIKDAKALVADPRFPSLWVATPGTQVQGLGVLRKRVELVLSWVDYFAFTSNVSVNTEMEKMAIKTLGRIERAAWLLSHLSYPKAATDQAPKELLFELIELKANKTAKSAKEILDQMLDPIVETGMPKLPSPVNDWTPEEIPNTPYRGSNIIKKKDPFYSAPVILPKPTNDWIMSL